MSTATRAKRLLYLSHRWLGVGAGVLMVLWLVSGVVMLFVGYPKLLPQERLRHQLPLSSPGCCLPVEAALRHSRSPDTVQQITLRAVAHQPRYLLKEAQGDLIAVDAMSGARVPRLTEAAALVSARAFLPGAVAVAEGQTQDDRWTHSGALNPHRPLFKVQMQDAEGTLLYVSSTTGEVVMEAPRLQRRLNYVGAWLHWLYMFRDGPRDPVWSWLVIGLSALGTLAAVTGAVAGVWRWRFSGTYRSGARTPYRAFVMRWHHTLGLVFGGVLIAWIFSGLMSMNPLGIFDPKGPKPDLAAYRLGLPGAVRPAIQTTQALALLQASGFNTHEVEWRVLGGTPYLLARNAQGSTRLVWHDGDARHGFTVQARWPESRLQAAGARLFKAGVRSVQVLQAHDAYHYQRGAASMYAADDRALPALKIDFEDPGETSVYLNLQTGDVALSVDRSQRVGRWLFNLLHSWDLPLFLRFAATRELLLTLLCLAALLIAGTGTVLGYRRLRRKVWRSP